MWFVYNKGIKKEILDSIKNKEYSHEQLVSMFQELNQRKETKNKGILLAMLSFVLCAVFILMTSMMNSTDTSTMLITVIAILLVFVIAFVFVKVNMVDKAKRQFLNALKIGYPEFVDEFNSIG